MTRKVLLISVVVLVLYFGCIKILAQFLNSPILPVTVLGLCIVSALWAPVPMGILQGIQFFSIFALLQALTGPARLVFCGVAAISSLGVDGVLFGLFLSQVVVWLVAHTIVRKRLPAVADSTGEEKMGFWSGIPVLVMNLAFALLTQIDLILVNKLFSSADASTFASAAILGRSIIYLPGAMVLAMFPMVSETKARNKSTHPILFKSIGMTILTSGFGALLFFFWSKPILHLFFGERYLGSAEILKYYALAMLPMGLLTILTQYLIARGHALFGYVVLAGAALEIGLIYWLHSSLLSIVSIVGTVGIILFSVGFIFSLIEKPATLVEPYEIAPTVGA